VDTGWAGFNHRDAGRIAAAAKAAGVKRSIPGVTHYHADHAGARSLRKAAHSQLRGSRRPNETTRDAQVLYNEYVAFSEKGNRIQVNRRRHPIKVSGEGPSRPAS